MKRYNPQEIEKKWQQIWEETKPFAASEDDTRPRVFLAEMFPYPSGAGLHVGHVRNDTIVDALTRFHAQQDMNVLRANGYDTFGLPAENYAIKTGTSPQEATATNIKNFRHQLKRLGYYIDWNREQNTSDPEYYKWTQWCFLQLYKAGLAYQAESYQWWCPVDKTVLANEQVEGGCCWRCGTEVEKKKMKQWFFKITAYADELLDEIDSLEWPDKIKTMQKNWIGRSRGAEIDFAVAGSKEKIKAFTTRPDTLFGATFMVLAPEHSLVPKLVNKDTKQAVDKYRTETLKKSEIERQENKEKTGVFTGSYAINPATQEKMPIWIADYVLASYGEGAIMAVPAHDERDHEFASAFNLPIKQVIAPTVIDPEHPPIDGKEDTKRNVIMCIIKHPTENKYLTLDWAELGWHVFVMGGIEEGEDAEAAARREIAEETGFTNLKFKRIMPLEVNSLFYAAHKDLNRSILTTVLEFELENLDQVETHREAHEKFEIEWTAEDELGNLGPITELPFILNWLRNEPLVYTGDGMMINSGEYNGQESAVVRESIIKWLNKEKIGKAKTTYRMRDWLISRQRYWGAPIPIAYDKEGNAHPIPEDQLPVMLPTISDYKPDDSGRSALAKSEKFMKVTIDGEEMTRETDTMDGYACSSWYLWRYTDPRNAKQAWDPAKANFWNPIDYYVGGDHAVAHLLYVRFWCKFFNDQGLLDFREPIKRLLYNGYINAPDGRKMSKSLGNVIDPLEIIDDGYGADTLRTYELFIAPYDLDASWSTRTVGGVYRFLNRCWNLLDGEHTGDATVMRHQTIKKVTEDIRRYSFNTAIAALMEYVNYLNKNPYGDEDLTTLARLLKPFAPHIASEMLEMLKSDDTWPTWDEKYLVQDTVELVVQINGKVRAKIEVSTEITDKQAEIEAIALADPRVKNHTAGKTIAKTIYIAKNHLLSLVIK